MEWIMSPLICAIIFGCIYKVIEMFVHRRERLNIISKLSEVQDLDFKGISFYSSGNKFTSLRIGWLMLGIGTGLLLGFFINLAATMGQYADPTFEVWRYNETIGGIVYISCICICGGAGLIKAYMTERKAEQ